MRQVRFLCLDWEISGHFALALQPSSVSVSSRSRALGPWKPGLHYALLLLMPFGSCDLGEAVSTKVHFLCYLLWASIWLLHGHDLPLKPVCICFVPMSALKCHSSRDANALIVILPLLNTLLGFGVKPIWIQIPTSHKLCDIRQVGKPLWTLVWMITTALVFARDNVYHIFAERLHYLSSRHCPLLSKAELKIKSSPSVLKHFRKWISCNQQSFLEVKSVLSPFPRGQKQQGKDEGKGQEGTKDRNQMFWFYKKYHPLSQQ